MPRPAPQDIDRHFTAQRGVVGESAAITVAAASSCCCNWWQRRLDFRGRLRIRHRPLRKHPGPLQLAAARRRGIPPGSLRPPGYRSPRVRVIYVSEPVAVDERLYATMRRLMVVYARRQAAEIPGPRGVVKRQDALDAVIQLAAVVDEAVQAAAIPVDRGMHAAAMLMVLREFVQPLPPDWDGDGCTDYLKDDLAMMVTALREARQATGHKG